MKKSLVATGVALAMGSGVANAAFLTPGLSGTITFDSGCFTFGACVIGDSGSLGNVEDNDTTVRGNGSGVAKSTEIPDRDPGGGGLYEQYMGVA